MDDDDLEEIPSKMPKLDIDNSEKIEPKNLQIDSTCNDSEDCAICLEPYTTKGDHKIAAISCGHIFGQKCIENWIYKNRGGSCPVCKKSCTKKDVNLLYFNVKAINVLNNEESIRDKEKVKELEIKYKDILEENSQLKLMTKLMSIEMTKLNEENKSLREMKDLADFQIQQTQTNSVQKNNIDFQLVKKIQISVIGDCRVMGYSYLDNNICVSCPSSNRLVTGYGVRVVDIHMSKVKKYINIHSNKIRNIDYSPFFSTNLMLSCSLDKSVKFTSTNSDSIVSHYNFDSPVWSCAWSNNNNIVYAGLANGKIEEIDNRNLSAPVKSIHSLSGGPILSLRYISANEYIKESGLLATNSQGIIFLKKPSLESSDGLSTFQLDTVLMASQYGGSIVGSALNDQSYHLLSTFRPNEFSKNVRYLISSIGSKNDDDDGIIYASEIKSYFGSNTMDFMSRSCFVYNDSLNNFVVTACENTSSIKVWDLASNLDCLTLYPKDVTQRKPIIDFCQYANNPISFAAINSDNLYFYKKIE